MANSDAQFWCPIRVSDSDSIRTNEMHLTKLSPNEMHHAKLYYITFELGVMHFIRRKLGQMHFIGLNAVHTASSLLLPSLAWPRQPR